MSDTSDSCEILAAAPLGHWNGEGSALPLAVLPCLGTRYDRNGFPSYPGADEGE